MQGLISHSGTELVGRQELRVFPTPEGTATWKPAPHYQVVQAILESLAMRNLEVVRDQYAVTPDGMRMFGVLEINVEESGVRFAIGCRNSHDKTFSLGLTVGYRVFVCDNLAFHGDFTPITRKHSKNLDVAEVVDFAITRMQRHFEPMKRQIDAWKGYDLPDARAKAIIYDAFIAGELDAPKSLAREVHDQYFHPRHPEFEPRTMFSLSNAFTSAFHKLEPISRFQATAKLAPFLARYN
jgi:hypothetical protein